MIDIFQYLKEKKGIEFTDQQKSVISHVGGPSLVLAVPGAGKTASLTARTGNLILNHGIPAENILTMTFSRASAKDMEDRFNYFFDDFLGNIDIKTNFSTIHSFAYKIVNRHYRYNEMIESKNAGNTKSSILRNIYRDNNKGYITEEEYDDLTTGISYIKNKMFDINLLNSNDIKDISDIKNFKEIFISYENTKADYGFIDFDDMLTICYKILSVDEKILNKYKKQYEYIQLDEAQDTSTVQFAIVSLLAKPRNNIFYLADDDQSIYESFRGSDLDYILNFKENYPNGTIYFMEQNFRSTKNIIDISNNFIQNNRNRYFKDMFTNKDEGRPITIVTVQNEKAELEHIIKSIQESDNYSDNAVLYRNNLLSVPLVNELDKNNIPFYIREQDNRFFVHWVLKDILAFIRLAINVRDIHSFDRIKYKSNLYLNKEQIVQFQKTFYSEDNKSVIDALLEIEGLEDYKKRNILNFGMNLEYLREGTKNEGIADTILDKIEYDFYLEKNAERLGFSYENLSNVTTAFRLITMDCENLEEVLERMQRLETLMKTSYHNRNKNAVTLTTVHGAKGLEFDRVFIMSMVENIFPTKQAEMKLNNNDNSLIEEERRLCYVAMTRGRKYVDLITLENKNGREILPSRFVRELINISNREDEPVTTADTSTMEGINVCDFDFLIGDIVEHKKFGKGEIVNINIPDEIIGVKFHNYGTKKLSYKICIENNILVKSY